MSNTGKLHVARVGASNLFRITKEGPGRIPKYLEGRFTSEGVASDRLKRWHADKFPELYQNA